MLDLVLYPEPANTAAASGLAHSASMNKSINKSMTRIARSAFQPSSSHSLRRLGRHGALSAVLLLSFVLSFAYAQPTVIVSIHPYYDITRQIAGDAADVQRMLPAGVSPHTFDPTPRDVRRIANADLIIVNGGIGIDGWLLEMLDAVGGGNVPILNLFEASNFADIVGERYGEQFVGDFINAHMWLDADFMADLVPLIAEALESIAPEHTEMLRDNAEALEADLRALDAELKESLAEVAGAPFVPFHDAWPYFAQRYGLDLIVEIEPFPGREPSPQYLSMALGLIRESGAQAVFSEVQLRPEPAEVVAENAGVRLYIMDPVGGSAETSSYQDLMRFNRDVLLQGLSPLERD